MRGFFFVGDWLGAVACEADLGVTSVYLQGIDNYGANAH